MAKAEGSEYSGSTAWEAAVCTRLWLERRADGFVELHRRKANYAAHDSVVLELQAGAFSGVTADADDSIAVQTAESVVKAALATFTACEVATSRAPTASTNLVRLAAKEGLLNGTPPPVAIRALNIPIDRGEIKVNADLGWRTSDRH